MLINDWDIDKQLAKEELPVFQKYARLFFLGKSGINDFPSTRTVTNKGIPMGWIKLNIVYV